MLQFYIQFVICQFALNTEKIAYWLSYTISWCPFEKCILPVNVGNISIAILETNYKYKKYIIK